MTLRDRVASCPCRSRPAGSGASGPCPAPSTSLSIACGWSPVGWKGASSRNSPRRVTSCTATHESYRRQTQKPDRYKADKNRTGRRVSAPASSLFPPDPPVVITEWLKVLALLVRAWRLGLVSTRRGREDRRIHATVLRRPVGRRLAAQQLGQVDQLRHRVEVGHDQTVRCDAVIARIGDARVRVGAQREAKRVGRFLHDW